MAGRDPTTIVGRAPEQRLLGEILDSPRAELVAVYGRRRVGKTFLVRQFVAPRVATYVEATGQRDASTKVQLHHFGESLATAFGRPFDPLGSWDEAFGVLTRALEAEPPDRPAVVFLDELPWLARRRSGVLQALDFWWNSRLSRLPRVKLIVCGSAAGWMVDKVVRARGGLHNRITRQIVLLPFTVPETRDFLRARGSRMGLAQVVELYMAVGGIPYYLEHVAPRHSAAQAIQALCFDRSGILRDEFQRLFTSLFEAGLEHERIVRTIAGRREGILRSELVAALGTASGGGLAKKLRSLEDAGFIARVTPWGHKKRNLAVRVVDPFVFFHLRWIEGSPRGVFDDAVAGHWLDQIRTPAYRSWAGFAFETLCMQHAGAIKEALGLGGVAAEVGAWRYVPPAGSRHTRGAQVDLLFDRADGVITLCEIKHGQEPFTVDKAYARELRDKIEIFERVTRTRKDVQLALVTTHGLRRNIWSEDLVDQDVSLEQVFG